MVPFVFLKQVINSIMVVCRF